MNANRSHYKRHLRLGPGGMGCTCCGPAPGKDRKHALRMAKKRERREAMREARDETPAE